MSSRTVLLGGGVVLLLVGALAGYLYGVNSTPTKTAAASTSLDAYDQVADSFANHMLFVSSRNASAMASQYESNASVIWTTIGLGYAGTYVGANNIFILMNNSFIGRGSSFSVGNVTHSVVNMTTHSAVVNSSFAFFGQRTDLGGNFNGTVSAQDFYVYSAANGGWLISRETWNFLSFNAPGPLVITG
jgi:hypothetical protein